MELNIPVNYPIGSTVYLLQGMHIIAKEVKAIRIYEFTIDARNTTPPPPRYLLKDDGHVYYEEELFGSPDEILSHLEEQVKSLTPTE